MKAKLRPGLIFIVVLILNSCALIRPSAKKLNRLALKNGHPYDVIIVPGIPFSAPCWDRTMQLRVVWAVNLFNKGLTKNIIFSGSAVYTPYCEAEIMGEYAHALGVPRENIFYEKRAEHSTENAWYGWKLARKLGFTKIALASDPFQTRLLLGFLKRRTPGVKAMPAIFSEMKKIPVDTPQIDFAKFERKNFRPITQTQSKRYRRRGTLGLNINYKETDGVSVSEFWR